MVWCVLVSWCVIWLNCWVSIFSLLCVCSFCLGERLFLVILCVFCSSISSGCVSWVLSSSVSIIVMNIVRNSVSVSVLMYILCRLVWLSVFFWYFW